MALKKAFKKSLKAFIYNGGLSAAKLTLFAKEIFDVCRNPDNIIFFEVLQNYFAA